MDQRTGGSPLYELGEGVPQDYEQARGWYRKAAEQGDAAAQYSLGCLYEHARGVAEDRAKALEWYRKASKQGHSGAREAEKHLTDIPLPERKWLKLIGWTDGRRCWCVACLSPEVNDGELRPVWQGATEVWMECAGCGEMLEETTADEG